MHPSMAHLKKYDVVINGTQTTLLLTDEDAKARGLYVDPKPVEVKQAPAPLNKARSARTKG